jgi:hypothetical protein
MKKPEFFAYLAERQNLRQPMKCSIELSNNANSHDIALSITTKHSGPMFSVITPNDVIGHVLARAMVDVVYYNVFFETLSFQGTNANFIDPGPLRQCYVLSMPPVAVFYSMRNSCLRTKRTISPPHFSSAYVREITRTSSLTWTTNWALG